MAMTGFDVAVFVVVGLLAAGGFMRGFVQESISLFAWAFSLFCIHNLHGLVAAWLEPHIGTSSGASVLAFVLLMIVPYMLTRMLAKSLGSASRNSVLGPIDRVLGFGFGAVKGTVIVVMAFSILVLGYDTIWGAEGRPEWITKSRTYPFINASSDALVKAIDERRHGKAGVQGKADDASTDASSADSADDAAKPPAHSHKSLKHRLQTASSAD